MVFHYSGETPFTEAKAGKMQEDIILDLEADVSADDIDDLDATPTARTGRSARSAEYPPGVPIYKGAGYVCNLDRYQFIHVFVMTPETVAKVDHIETSVVLSNEDGEEVTVAKSEVPIDEAWVALKDDTLVPGGTGYGGYSAVNQFKTTVPPTLSAGGFRSRVIGKDGEVMRTCLWSNPATGGTRVTSYMTSVKQSLLADWQKAALREAWSVSKRFIDEELGLRQLKQVAMDGTDTQPGRFSPGMFDSICEGGHTIDMGSGISLTPLEIRMGSGAYAHARFLLRGWGFQEQPVLSVRPVTGGTPDSPTFGEGIYWKNVKDGDAPGEYELYCSHGFLEATIGSLATLYRRKTGTESFELGPEVSQKMVHVTLPYLRDFCAVTPSAAWGRDGYPPEWVKAWCGANVEWNEYLEAGWSQ